MSKIEREEEITHPPNERAILPFDMLSPGDNDFQTFITRWLERQEAELKEEKEGKKGEAK